MLVCQVFAEFQLILATHFTKISWGQRHLKVNPVHFLNFTKTHFLLIFCWSYSNDVLHLCVKKFSFCYYKKKCNPRGLLNNACLSLFDSLTCQIQQVLKNKGLHTKYWRFLFFKTCWNWEVKGSKRH